MVDFGFGPDFCFSGLTALSGIAHALPSRSAPGTRPSRTYWFTQRIETPHTLPPTEGRGRFLFLLFPVRIDSLSKLHLFLSSIITGHRLDAHNVVSLIKLLLYTTSRR